MAKHRIENVGSIRGTVESRKHFYERPIAYGPWPIAHGPWFGRHDYDPCENHRYKAYRFRTGYVATIESCFTVDSQVMDQPMWNSLAYFRVLVA